MASFIVKFGTLCPFLGILISLVLSNDEFILFLNDKVVRLCAKSREAVSSPVEHLTLHYQVGYLQGSIEIYPLVIYHERLDLAFFPCSYFICSCSQVRHLDTSEKSELHKLQQLKDEQGVLLCLLGWLCYFDATCVPILVYVSKYDLKHDLTCSCSKIWCFRVIFAHDKLVININLMCNIEWGF